MSLTIEETAWRDHLESLPAHEAAQASKRMFEGVPQTQEEVNYQLYHLGLVDDAAREESEFQVSGSIIDRNVVQNIEHDQWIHEFDIVVGVPFTNNQTMDSICKRKKRPQT